MENVPLVSVIVPNYNHARFLAQRMESILAQTFRDFEVILLDDCSTDNSREVIERFRGHEKVAGIFYNEKNSGSTFLQWKKGIDAACGKYLWIAESDDFCDLDFLEKGVKQMEKGHALFCARTINVDENGQPLENKREWMDDLSPVRWKSGFENNGPAEVKDFLFLKNTIPNASAVLFNRTGRIDGYLGRIAGMRYCGDWLFWMFYLLDSPYLVYSAETKNYFRSHATVTRGSQNHEKRNDEVLRVLRFVLRHPLSRGNRSMLVRYYFDTHFFKKGKRSLGWNSRLAMKQLAISFHFAGCWARYYFS